MKVTFKRKTTWKEKDLFFLSGFSFTDTDDSQNSRRREGPSFISLYHFHSFPNIQTFITRLLLDEIYHLIELPFDLLMMWRWFLFVYVMIMILAFLLQQFQIGSRWIWTRLTTTLVLQANRLTKCASHPLTKCACHFKGSETNLGENYSHTKYMCT